MGSPGFISATTSRIALAPMSSTATGRSGSTGAGAASACPAARGRDRGRFVVTGREPPR